MATNNAFKRLTREYLDIRKNPVPFIIAKPLETNILEWHYVITGPPDSPYEGGEYHGKLIFPSEYPFKPPAIKMLTPNGRFQIDYKLCLTMSDYHPNLWNPAWSVATILTGLLSFMLEDKPTAGSINTTVEEKIRLSKQSHQYNINNPVFKSVFPDLCILPNKEINMVSLNCPTLNPGTLCKRNINSKNTNTNTIPTSNENINMKLESKNKIIINMNNTAISFLKPIRNNIWKIIFGLLIVYLVLAKVLTRIEIKISN